VRSLVPVLALVVFAVTLGRPAAAEVVSSAPGGFVVRTGHDVTKSPLEVWDALVDIGSWWTHSFSGDPGNFTLDAEPGGAWIEHLPDGGFVEHLRVVFAEPGKRLTLRGTLGPLMEEAALGTFLVVIDAHEEATRVTITYKVAGYRDGGFEEWAGPVDGVIAEAAARLARRIETGSAE
jgi:uncharacterized protein YndB with AHSA1/START domain